MGNFSLRNTFPKLEESSETISPQKTGQQPPKIDKQDMEVELDRINDKVLKNITKFIADELTNWKQTHQV